MGRQNDLKNLTNSLKGLIVFEHKTAQLYEDVSEKVRNLPLVKALMLQISLDSQKHAMILKGLAQSLPKTDWRTDGLPKTIAEAWRSIDDFQMELTEVDEIADLDLGGLPRQLSVFENIMSEAYDVVVQYDNLVVATEALGKIYRIDLELLKQILMEIIHDEEHHKEILTTIEELLEKKREEKVEATPVVRFQNPDAWNSPIM